MSRKNRIWNPSMFDHVVMRGNNRQNIYESETDVRELIRVFHYAYMKHPFTLIAYCIMSNHYHLLIRSPEVPLGKVMALINRRYTDYYKKRYNYTGSLYEGRYYAKMAETPHSLLQISRYIHRNPIETKVPMVEQLSQYSHSSYPFYANNAKSPYPFLDLELLPTLLPLNSEKTVAVYCLYCERTKEKELVGKEE